MTLPIQNLVPFLGMVQSDEDPAHLGRCKVRCFGFHPPVDDTNVLNDHLPWAVRLDSTIGAVQSPSPRAGELVFGFFLDGRDAQFPVVVGSIPTHGMGIEKNAWVDLDGLQKSTTLAHAPEHTGIDTEESPAAAAAATGAGDNISAASGDYEVTVPSVELTSGKGAASLNSANYHGSKIAVGDNVTLQHSSGTVIQINSDGAVIISSDNDMYTDVKGNQVDVSQSSRDIIVKDGQFNVKVNGDCNLFVNGDMNHTVKGNYKLNVSGAFDISAGISTELHSGKVAIRSNSTFDLATTKAIYLGAGTDIGLKAAVDAHFNIAGSSDFLSAGDLRISSNGTLHLLGGGNARMDAERVDIGDGADKAAPSDKAVPSVSPYRDPGETTPSKAPKGAGFSGRSVPKYSGSGGSVPPDEDSEVSTTATENADTDAKEVKYDEFGDPYEYTDQDAKDVEEMRAFDSQFDGGGYANFGKLTDGQRAYAKSKGYL